MNDRTVPSIVLDDQGAAPQDIELRLKTIPAVPGVYLMRDEAGEIIYVGKAKSLRSRVRSYFRGGDGRVQIEYLLRRVRRVDTVVTGNEQQAFTLERELIAKHRPRYNVRLKDDRAYLSIRIDEHAAWPRIELVRKVENDGATYFGPYSFSYELRAMLEIIKRVVPLRTCNDTVFFNRQRPCLEYQIKRCAGPCCLPVDRQQYGEWVRQAIAILDGRSESLVSDLTTKMNQAAAELRFEEAAVFRDRLQTLENIKIGQAFSSYGGEDRDVFAVYREDQLAALSVVRVRAGRVAETLNYSFSEVAISDDAILETAIEQFYRGSREIPEEVVLPMEIENEESLLDMLHTRRGSKVLFVIPQRGLKARVLALAQLNARQHYIASFEADRRGVELSKELARTLRLRQVPRRIECVDISNLQGSDIVGAVVVFADGLPERRSYRKYRISFQHKPDDFASIYEVVKRRLLRAAREGSVPDLLVIDGGAQQLKKAIAARDEVQVAVEVVALAKIRDERRGAKGIAALSGLPAKKPERVFKEGVEEPIVLDATAPVTHFIQRIRDEVHRYVLAFHRQTRARRMMASALDEVPGLGVERKRRLLKMFGSVREIAALSIDELTERAKLPRRTAESLLSRLGTPSPCTGATARETAREREAGEGE